MKEFKSFGAFALHLERLAATSGEVKHHILDKAGEEVQKTAQGMIGDYQQAIGPYVAWEELADRTKAERSRLGFSENDPGFRTGAMQRSVKHTVSGEDRWPLARTTSTSSGSTSALPISRRVLSSGLLRYTAWVG
jgi:hypothetical protein